MNAPRAISSAPPEALAERGFLGELRAILVPEKRWHYLYHLLVLLVGLSYWLASLAKHPEASWAEHVMYRAEGDNQVFPVVTALSQLNFGDPTDVVYHGEGVAGFQVVVLFPYALAYALLGAPGYMVADGLLSLAYFVAVTLLLRRCNFSAGASLLAACALATGSLQNVSHKVGQAVFSTLGTLGMTFSEWHWPDLVGLMIYSKRIPRPMVTEIFVVLCLYLLLKQWQQRSLPTFWRGMALGAALAAVAQGDPYSAAVLGLLLLWVGLDILTANRWQIPWAWLAGGLLGSLACGWYFVLQRLYEPADAAVRFGLGAFPRSQLVPLPGYAPVLRVVVVGILGLLILNTIRRLHMHAAVVSPKAGKGKKSRPAELPAGPADQPVDQAHLDETQLGRARSVAFFWMGVVMAAWVAQPVQLWLFGKGAQIYHYLLATLPAFYSYALVMLVYNLYWVCRPPKKPGGGMDEWLSHSRWTAFLCLAPLSAALVLFGIEAPLQSVWNDTNSRMDKSGPWFVAGNNYRPSFRALDREFRENPALRQARSFGTLNPEVNILLTAFHGKRAFLPDNAYTTLDDYRLEERLCEMGKLMAFTPDSFANFLAQAGYVVNFWAGCAKYWCGREYQFAPDWDYDPAVLAERNRAGKQVPWPLSIPRSEMMRYFQKYSWILARQSNARAYPEVVVLDAEETRIGLKPWPKLYRECYTNTAFAVYLKTL